MAHLSAVALLVDNICNINNGGVEQVACFIAAQPLSVRARFIERLSSLIGAAAEWDAQDTEDGAVAIAKPRRA